MNLIETYANDCGVAIKHKPRFPSNYFPTPDKYITVHASSGMGSKNYDYFSEAVWMIKDKLMKNGYLIVQVGLGGDKPVEGCLQYMGVTDMRQSAYVIENSSLHVGNDSIWMHVAGAYGVPYVGLYGPTLAKVCEPSFGKGVSIESNRNGKRPSHKDKESKKTINLINPEEVAREILVALNIELGETEHYESLHIGDDYSKTILEIVPDHFISPEFLKGQLLNVRMDFNFSEVHLAQILQHYQSVVITDQSINEDLIKALKRSIKLLVYVFDKGNLDKPFVKMMHDSGVNYQLSFKEDSSLSEEENKKNLCAARSSLFDFNPVLVHPSPKVPEDVKSEITNKTYFKTNKFLLSDRKVYLSLAHLKRRSNVESENDNFQQIGSLYLEDPDFWDSINHFYILNVR